MMATGAEELGGGGTPLRDAGKLVAAADREFRAEKYDAATKLYGEALAVAPEARTYYARHKAFLKRGKLGHAIADLTAAVDRDPTFHNAYLQRANLYLMTGRCSDAVTDYETVLRLDPHKRDAVARMPHAQTCARALERAEHARRHGDWHTVRDQLSVAMEADRATAASTLMLQRAEASFHLGDWEQCLADAARVLKLDGALLEGYILRARALLRYGDYPTARAHWQECLVYDPEHRVCKEGYRLVKAMLKARERGDAAASQGRWEEAITVWTEALTLDGGDNPAWRKEVVPKLAKAHLRRREFSTAAAWAEQGLAADDGHAELHHILGQTYLEREMWEEAARHGNRAHELDRGNHDYADFAQRAEAALKQSKSKDYYRILGVARSADDKAIKRAYRAAAMEWHPDKHSGEGKEKAERMFRDIAEAYEVLSDPEKKGRYDRGEDVMGQQHPGGGGFHGFPAGHPFMFQQGGGFTFRFG